MLLDRYQIYLVFILNDLQRDDNFNINLNFKAINELPT